VKVRDLVRLLESEGWQHVRTAGSHRIFKHAAKPRLVTVAGRSGEDVPTGTSKTIFEGLGIGEEMSIRYSVIYEKGPTSWGASVPDLPGCIAVGGSRQEAETLIREAIKAHLEALRECGIAVPEALHEIGEVEVTAA
jgi:predicted RNA binding protein YcfA (HicA-like mRNA interferase family)/predicted RNase H-like HicB family nuclease